jgi:hypothetical protein
LAKSLIFKKHLHTALTVGLAIAYHPLQYLISGLFSLQIIPPDGYGSGYYSGVGELGVVIVVAGKAYSIIAANEDHSLIYPPSTEGFSSSCHHSSSCPSVRFKLWIW